MPGVKCTICIEADRECTYLEAAAKRSPPQSYIESLEKRLAESEALVRQLRAELAAIRTTVALFFMRMALHNLATPHPPPRRDDLVHLDLARRLQKLQVGPLSERRFIGKNSGVC
ncbi:hypothetical protein C8R47DRAFT_256036 [Mycena vitilis]|nr:hypothetical protein C8R47DRAFT_256036 [Mycena vitilis]